MLRRTISGLCFYLLLGGLLAHAGQFLDAPQYTVGTNPQAVAVGDFNGDGKPDVAVVNTGSTSVSILLGNGDGTLTAKTSITTGSGPFGIAVGDFNNDGKLDLAVTNSSANTVSIFLGNGDGTFTLKSSPTTGAAPNGIAVGDFNKDGNLDLVVTDSGPGKAGVLLGNGDGTFQAEVEYNTGNAPVSVVVADFNNDGYPDIAVANKSNLAKISVLLNNGNGTFGTQFQSSVGGTPVSLTAGDFNHDGNIDLAVACQPISPSYQGLVSVLIGQGNGGFVTHVDYNVGSSPGVSSAPTSIAAGVFTTSGHLDLAVTAGNDNTMNILTGNGDANGTFNNVVEVRYGTGATPYSAAVATLIPGGKNDIIVANSGAGSVSVLMGNGDAAGTFQSRVDYDSGPQPNAVVVADFDGDGNLDMAFADGDCTSCTPNSISVVLGNGDGTFRAQQTFPTASSGDADTYALVAADFNGDGKPDIAVVNNKTNNVGILLNSSTGPGQISFAAAVDYAVGTAPTSIAVGDFNGDGHPDLVVANNGSNSVTVLINNGSGGFTAGPTITVGSGPYAVATAAMGSSTNLSIVVANETANTISVIPGNGNGTFGTIATFTVTGNPNSLAIGDFNGDGYLDLAVGESSAQYVSLLLGTAGGGFGTATQYPTGAIPGAIVAGDFTANGHLSLALSIPSRTGTVNQASLLVGNGTTTSTFQAPIMPPSTASTLFPVGSLATAEAQSIAAGDFNNDGTLDLAVANGLSSTVSVLLSTAGTAMTVGSSAGNPSYGAPVTFTANVAASVGAVPPTGTVTFTSGSTTLGSPATVANGQASVTTTTLPVGTADPIQAAYSGDANFLPHTVSITQQISRAGTTSVLLSSLNPSNLGQSVTLSATISSDTIGTPTGSVTFLDGATSIGTGTLASGAATLTTSSLAAGTHTITVSYGGDTNYTTSVSPAVSEVVVGPAFTFGASALTPSSIAAGASSTSTITITPTGGLSPASVQLHCSSIVPAVTPAPACSFSAITVGGNGVGTATLTVSTTGPAQPALKHRQRAALSAVWLLLPAAVFGALFLPKPKRGKFVALGLVALIAGGCVFQAACGGGSGSKGTTTPPLSASSTTVASSANPSFTGQAVTLTADVTSSASGTPTGTVTFLDGTTTLGTGTLASGSATYQSSTLAAGTHTITASYSGDTNFKASASTALSQLVNASTASNTYTITVQGTATGAPTQSTGLTLTVQ